MLIDEEDIILVDAVTTIGEVKVHLQCDLARMFLLPICGIQLPHEIISITITFAGLV